MLQVLGVFDGVYLASSSVNDRHKVLSGRLGQIRTTDLGRIVAFFWIWLRYVRYLVFLAVRKMNFYRWRHEASHTHTQHKTQDLVFLPFGTCTGSRAESCSSNQSPSKKQIHCYPTPTISSCRRMKKWEKKLLVS